jgi:hypothetical protein
MFSKTKIALSVALILGAASAALASNEHDQSASETQAAREAGNPLPWWWNAPNTGRGASAFAYAYQPVMPQHSATRRVPGHK